MNSPSSSFIKADAEWAVQLCIDLRETKINPVTYGTKELCQGWLSIQLSLSIRSTKMYKKYVHLLLSELQKYPLNDPLEQTKYFWATASSLCLQDHEQHAHIYNTHIYPKKYLLNLIAIQMACFIELHVSITIQN